MEIHQRCQCVREQRSGNAALTRLGTEPDLFSSLPDKQLLAVLLGNRASREYRGSLAPFFAPQRPHDAHDRCIAARELIARWLREEATHGDALCSPSAVRDFLRLHFAARDFESFVAIFLDAQNRVISCDELFRGTLTQTAVYPREVVKAALRHSAAAVLVAHNHPSGLAEPSHQDIALTRTLSDALSLIDVRVLDHFIVAGPSLLSFAERGLV